MKLANIVPYTPKPPQQANLTDPQRVNPILVDFFWIDFAISIEKMIETKSPKEFVKEINSFFINNPESEWTYREVSLMFNELIDIVLSRTSDVKRKIISTIESIILVKGKDSNLVDMICQMKMYFDANDCNKRILTWKMISQLNFDTIDYL
jgi:hypothetical protein